MAHRMVYPDPPITALIQLILRPCAPPQILQTIIARNIIQMQYLTPLGPRTIKSLCDQAMNPF